MTIKLYWEKPYQTEFTAKVTDLTQEGVVLDQTLFYPKGGGQECDKGFLKHKEQAYLIEKVTQKAEDIIHHLPPETLKKFHLGDEISGEINWNHRYGLMKAHTSQHLLSALLLNDYDIDTGRAYINFEDVTIQLTKEIGLEELKKIFEKANEIGTVKNFPIIDNIVDTSDINYKLIKLRGDTPEKKKLRLIEIEDLDRIFCGGTHVKNTIEIGPLFIYDFKKGMEIKYYVGNKASKLITDINLDLISLSIELNQPIDQVKDLIDKRLENIKQLEQEKEELLTSYFKNLSKSSDVEFKSIGLSVLDMDVENNLLIKLFKEFPPNRVLILNLDKQRVKILSNTEKVRANTLIRELINKFGGKGGGSPSNAQGIIEFKRDGLISEIIEYLKRD